MQAKHCKATFVFKMEETIKLHVSLPSGRSEVVAVGLSATVLDLKRAAQESFGQCFLRLAAANGDLLVQKDSLQTCGLQNEQCLSASVLQPRITSTSSAVVLEVNVLLHGARSSQVPTAPNSKMSSEMSDRYAA